jgi:hypothetical protein
MDHRFNSGFFAAFLLSIAFAFGGKCFSQQPALASHLKIYSIGLRDCGPFQAQRMAIKNLSPILVLIVVLHEIVGRTDWWFRFSPTNS